MNHIDQRTPTGQRDFALFALMFNTGARVQEILNLRVCDLRLDPPLSKYGYTVRVRRSASVRSGREAPGWLEISSRPGCRITPIRPPRLSSAIGTADRSPDSACVTSYASTYRNALRAGRSGSEASGAVPGLSRFLRCTNSWSCAVAWGRTDPLAAAAVITQVQDMFANRLPRIRAGPHEVCSFEASVNPQLPIAFEDTK